MTERRNFTPKTKGLIRKRSGGTCEVHLVPRCMYPALPETCKRQGAEVDHITPDVFDGQNDPENGAFLCAPCHAIKTVVDNKLAKKAARRRGETGQQARRARAKAAGTYKPIPSQGFRKMGTKPWPKRKLGKSTPDK